MSSNEDMQQTKRARFADAPAADDGCRPAIFTKSRFAADPRCSADAGTIGLREELTRRPSSRRRAQDPYV